VHIPTFTPLPTGVKKRWNTLCDRLDERGRRLFVAAEVRAAGYGGLSVCLIGTSFNMLALQCWGGRNHESKGGPYRPLKNRLQSLWGADQAISELESSMSQVQVEQKTYQMPPREGFTIAHFLTVADVERSLRFYETVFGGRIVSRGDSSGAPGYIQIGNTWLLVNPGGGPTPDKPSITLSVPPDPNRISSFMNIRVADIQACYELWRSRGAEFITEPKPKYGETRCYIRDPDGYIIEVGQSNPGVAYG
jgi:catechol 2,3-dioxygenase-like lactoylglutathione lyase family enzyme